VVVKPVVLVVGVEQVVVLHRRGQVVVPVGSTSGYLVC
jgi:hypothetical protein